MDGTGKLKGIPANNYYEVCHHHKWAVRSDEEPMRLLKSIQKK
jgi:hypothetical protein